MPTTPDAEKGSRRIEPGDNDNGRTHSDADTGDRKSKSSLQSQPPGDEAPGASASKNAGQQSTIQEIGMITCIFMTQFLSLAGLAQSIAPLGIIGESFGVFNEGLLSWYPAAFSLTVGTFVLPAGELGDRFGHKRMLLIGFIWYAVWSVIAGVSVYSGSVLFSVARGFQGIGPATAVPNALAILGRSYPAGKKKNMLFALFGAAAPTGWVVGATFSAIFAQLTWWPWAFWSLAIACAVFALLAWVFIPEDRQRSTPAGPFDFLGCATGVTGLILINFAWSQAGVVGWSTVYTYVLLIVGIIALACFFYVELHVATNPLIPLKAMKAEVGLALAVIAAGWASFGIWVYYLWRLIEKLRGFSALAACAQSAPVAITGLLASWLTGFSLHHIGVPWVLFMSTLFFLTGQILIATVPLHQIYWGQTFVSIFIMPFGMDMSFPSATILVSNGTAEEHQGIAASLVNTVVNWSIALGLGIAATIARNVQGGDASAGATLAGFRGAWYFGIGLDALAAGTALFFALRHRK